MFAVWTLFGGVARAGDGHDEDKDQHGSTAADFLQLGVRPIAIGHHGVGPYPAGTPGLPTENTVESVPQAYSQGARVVEVDVQLTADGKLAVLPDDFLSDFTCVRGLTLAELQQRLPYVPELRDVLKVAREFNSRHWVHSFLGCSGVRVRNDALSEAKSLPFAPIRCSDGAPLYTQH